MSGSLILSSSVECSYAAEGFHLQFCLFGHCIALRKKNWKMAEAVAQIFEDLYKIFKDNKLGVSVRFKYTPKQMELYFPEESRTLGLFIIAKLFSTIVSARQGDSFNFKNRWIQFLMSRLSATLVNGLTAASYLHGRFVQMPLHHATPSKSLRHCFKHLLFPSFVCHSYTPMHNQAWRIKSLFISKTQKLPGTIAFLRSISRKEQFELKEAIGLNYPWIRDPLFFHPIEQKWFVPNAHNSEEMTKELGRMLEFRKTAGATSCPYMFGRVADLSLHLEVLKNTQLANFEIRQSRLYFEGGNLLCAINKQDQLYFLSGAHQLLASYIDAEQSKLFQQAEIEARVEEKAHSLEFAKSINEEDWKLTFNMVKLLSPQLANAQHVLKVCAKISVLKELFQEELGQKLVWIESGDGLNQDQVHYHLDLFLLPAPNGIIFLQSYAKCQEVLEGLLHSCLLDGKEIKQWKPYLKGVKHYRDLYQNRLNHIKQQLEALHFTVIEVPGCYPCQKGQAITHIINYLNGVAGLGARGTFAICNSFAGIGAGELYLRYAFRSFLKWHGIDHVYFNKSSAERLCLHTERPNKEAKEMACDLAGLHCLTQQILQKG